MYLICSFLFFQESSSKQGGTTQGGKSLESIDSSIIAQGNKIRDLKVQKASKEAIEVEVKALLAFKAEFKTAAGKDWDPKGDY